MFYFRIYIIFRYFMIFYKKKLVFMNLFISLHCKRYQLTGKQSENRVF